MNRQQMTNRPMQPAAEQMATQGRYGDSMLVHMNPVEVQGLASLSPTGSLTTNPMTGQPEAFLPFLAPLLGSMFGGSAFTALGGSALLGGTALGSGLTALGANAALASAVGSGLATTAVTGDLKEGIMSGLTGFGVGKALGAVGDVASGVGAATDTATAATQAAKDATTAATTQGVGLEQAGLDKLFNSPAVTGPANIATGAQDALTAAKKASAGMTNLERVQQGFGAEGAAGAFGSQLTSAGSLVPIAVGEGMRGERKAQDSMDRIAKELEDKKAATLARSTAVRDDAIALARKDYEYQGYGGYQGGGVVSLNPREYSRQMNGLQTIGMRNGGPAFGDNGGMGNFFGRRSGSAVPAQTQQALRPPNVVTADQLQLEADALTAQGKDPRAGFTGEINYFRKTPQEAGIPVDPEDQVDPSGGNVDPSEPIDTGSGPISIGGKGGQGGPGYKDIMPSFDGSNEEAVTQGGSGGKRNFTMADMEGLMNGNNSSLYDDSAMTKEVSAGKGSAKSAVDSIGIEAPIVPIYQQERQMRFAGGQVLKMQGGGIASVDPQNMAMEAPLSMGDQQPQMMQEADIMQVVSEVAQVLSQGIPADQFPPQLLAKLQELKSLIGEEQMMALITQAQTPPAPQGQPQMPPQGQPQVPPSNLSAEMGFPQAEPPTLEFQEGGATPNPETQLIEQTISAVLGELPQEQADIIINMFIDEFGQDAFELLREQALQSVVPNAQTEGVIRGQGGGMDDMVNGMIGSEQPVAVSPGEYIVPADVVSGLGDGSTDGGVQELDGMLDRVRQTRTGTTTQPAPMRTGGVLPA